MENKNLNSPVKIRRYYPYLFITILLGALFFEMTGVTNFSKIESGFPGRAWFIKSYSNLCIGLGNRVFDMSLVGKDGWLFYTGEDSLPDYQNTFPFSDLELKTIQGKLDRLSERLAAQGTHLLVVVPPNKNTIYSDYLPEEIPVIGPESRLDQLINYQKENGLVKIKDLRPVFLSARNETPVYYRTDTHWNDYGTVLAYQEMMKAMQPWFPEIEAHTLADFESVPAKYTGDIALNMIKSPDISEDVLRLTPLFEHQYSSRIWYPENDPKARANQVTSIAGSSLPRAIMYHDSFGSWLKPFLSDHFRQIDYFWGFAIDISNIESEKPDVVIIEITERYLSQLLVIPGDE